MSLGRRIATWVAGGTAALATAFALGPVPWANGEDLVAPTLPDDLEAWLAARDDAAPGVRPGSRSRITWADPETKARTPLSLVYLHGFSADPAEIDPVPARVAEAVGANLLHLRLTGHGQNGEQLARATAEAWMSDGLVAVEIAKRLGDDVVLMSTSTGGTLSLWLAAEATPDDVHALVLVSPNLRLAPPNHHLHHLPWVASLAASFGGERSWEPSSEAEALHWTSSYPLTALWPMLSLMNVVDHLDPAKVEAPILLVQTAGEDTVVNAPYARERLAQAGGLRTVRVEGVEDPMGHILAGDIVSPETNDTVAASITDFLRDLAPLR